MPPAIRQSHLRRGLLRPNRLYRSDAGLVWNTEPGGLHDLARLFWECPDPTQGMPRAMTPARQYRRRKSLTRNAPALSPRQASAATTRASSRPQVLEKFPTGIGEIALLLSPKTRSPAIPGECLAKSAPIVRPAAQRSAAPAPSRQCLTCWRQEVWASQCRLVRCSTVVLRSLTSRIRPSEGRCQPRVITRVIARHCLASSGTARPGGQAWWPWALPWW